MLKLVRNALAHKGSFVDQYGRTLAWRHIDKLHALQQKEGLHLANRLRKAHIEWQMQPMKVRLAAQVLSISVASALAECRALKIEGLEDSTGTEKFLKIINNTFDVLNSKSIYQKGWKKPI